MIRIRNSSRMMTSRERKDLKKKRFCQYFPMKKYADA